MNSIGSRVAAALGGRTQKAVAAEVGMTPDAFSRAVRGERGFAAVELARLAAALGEDVHYLITGEPDPNAMVVSARHAWDAETGTRDVPGVEDDNVVLGDIRLAYEQAGDVPPTPGLPADGAATAAALGDGFVRPFVARLEALGVDVVRVAELSTSYSFTLAGRRIIALNASGNWFRENWSLAHELGHLVLGHEGVMPGSARLNAAEREANAFAADLLMPAGRVRAVAWAEAPLDRVAGLVWEWGVSTEALKNRLATLGVPVGDAVADVLTLTTQALLHRHGRPDIGQEITARMNAAATRRFPQWLSEAHLERIAAGELGKGTLAWMLGVDAATLEVDDPAPPAPIPAEELDQLLG